MASNVENTLKRANELIEVGQKSQALHLLFELFNRRQHKKMWTKTHEDGMMLFVRLCVELRDNKTARDGLHSYRNIAQSQGPGSLEAVISYMLELSDERVAKALSQCKTNRDVSRIVDDLEEGGPSAQEALLLATIASERDRVRSEQAILVPWLKFSWDNLRSVLDILKNNPGLEQTYHATAHRAFAFCKTYGRKLEFRRLCDLLRNHLSNQTKFAKEGASSEEAGKLSAETMELHLGTRFEQLKVATALHLWLEGFKTIEDIHSIISLSVKKPSAQLMATYYQKLTQMFLVSGSFLFHAFAFRSYYDLSRERNKSLTPSQIESMASSVLLAAMAIPLPSVTSSSSSIAGANSQSLDMQKEKNRRMAQLLGFDQINPDRETLLKALRAGKVLEDCSNDVRELYFALDLQTNFDPQTLVKRCAPRIAMIRADPKLNAYANAIESLLIIRLISQLGRVFQSVRLRDFHEMIDELGGNGSISRLDAEKLIVKAVRNRQIPLRHGSSEVKIDHATGTIRFGENALEEQRTRDSLTDLAKRLSIVCKELKPVAASAPPSSSSSSQIAAKVMEEQNKIMERKGIIAQRKQEIEALMTHREKLRKERDDALKQARQERDARNLAKFLDKKKGEMDGVQKGNGEGEAGETLNNQDKDRLQKEKQEKAAQALAEAEKRIQTRAKRLDAMVRATRDAEKSILLKIREQRKIQDREDFYKEREIALQVAKEKHAEGLLLKQSFERMQSERAVFEHLMEERWQNNIHEAQDRWMEEQEERRKEEKLARARERKEIDSQKKKQQEDAQRLADSERERIREAEQRAAANPSASSAPKWRAKSVEAEKDREPPPSFSSRTPPPTTASETSQDPPKKQPWRPSRHAEFS